MGVGVCQTGATDPEGVVRCQSRELSADAVVLQRTPPNGPPCAVPKRTKSRDMPRRDFTTAPTPTVAIAQVKATAMRRVIPPATGMGAASAAPN